MFIALGEVHVDATATSLLISDRKDASNKVRASVSRCPKKIQVWAVDHSVGFYGWKGCTELQIHRVCVEVVARVRRPPEISAPKPKNASPDTRETCSDAVDEMKVLGPFITADLLKCIKSALKNQTLDSSFESI